MCLPELDEPLGPVEAAEPDLPTQAVEIEIETVEVKKKSVIQSFINASKNIQSTLL